MGFVVGGLIAVLSGAWSLREGLRKRPLPYKKRSGYSRYEFPIVLSSPGHWRAASVARRPWYLATGIMMICAGLLIAPMGLFWEPGAGGPGGERYVTVVMMVLFAGVVTFNVMAVVGYRAAVRHDKTLPPAKRQRKPSFWHKQD